MLLARFGDHRLALSMTNAIALLLSVFLANSRAAELSKPNLVLFLSDDHGFRDSSVYGATDVRTPNMQRLASDGMTFTHAFATSPACAPSRASLLTGLMPMRHGAMRNHAAPRADVKKLPAYLRELGYEIAAIGKVAHYDQAKLYGFDHFAHGGFHDDKCIPAAVQFLEQRTDRRPLCLLVGTNWPHVPWPENAPDYDLAKVAIPATHVDTPETRKWRARYYAAVTRFDEDLGTIYKTVQSKLGGNTLFIQASDHGAQWPFGKWNLYDAGSRVAFIAAWPNVIAPGSRSGAMLTLADILPTFIEAAGGTPPAGLDGRSFLGVLRGKTTEHRDRIFTTHDRDGKMNLYPMRAMRTRDWKYIRNLQPGESHTTHIDKGVLQDGGYWASWLEKAKSDAAARGIVERYHTRPAEELYNLNDDPFELKNLARDAAQKERLQSMRSDLKSWMAENGDAGPAASP